MIDYEKRLKEIQGENVVFKEYCDTCGYIDDTYTADVKEEIEVKGEKFEVSGLGLFCSKCKQRISNVDLDDQLLFQAYNAYRKKHGLLMSQEIKEIREYYGLTAKQFAHLLGFGDHTIYNYEAGALQSSANDALIKMVKTPAGLHAFLKDNIPKKLSKKVLQRLWKRVTADSYMNSVPYSINTKSLIPIVA